MNRQRIPASQIAASLSGWQLSDRATADHLAAYLESQKRLDPDEWRRIPRQMFWPPRVINGVRRDSLTIFFGSGISLASGMPDWMGLLRQLGLDADVERDPSASGDLLTLAELAAHSAGADSLQIAIRRAFSQRRLPTTTHFLLAAIALPLYITTNYDSLFEDAVAEIHGDAPQVVTNDLDVRSLFGTTPAEWDATLQANKHPCCVVKLHGSVAREGEHLILTRSDYRRHYRSNALMLQFVRYILGRRHTLFLGFSHRDPEVSRLIEDVIFDAENQTPRLLPPGFYSLQFDMLQKTPEVFAARGIVALQPSLVLVSGPGADIRTYSLAQGIVDLLKNADAEVDEVLSLDGDLRRIAVEVNTELGNLVAQLSAAGADALQTLKAEDVTGAANLTRRLVDQLGPYANQGAYLVDARGRMFAASCPEGLDSAKRCEQLKNVESRPYFRLAQSNRQAFVSEVFESIFNRNATLAACSPLLDSDRFAGLIFVAFQLDEAGFVARLRSMPLPNGATLLIADANGVLIVPPEPEFSPRIPAVNDLTIEGENPERNRGFEYFAVLQASRRDKRLDRLMQNIVPLAQDDDVQMLAPDLLSYFVVTELASARWKVALARYLRIRQ